MSNVGGIGRRIRWIVESHMKIKHSEFADSLGVTKQMVSRWVNDENNPPGDKSIEKIAEVSGVSRAWIKYGTGAPIGRPKVREASAAELAYVLEQIRDIVTSALADAAADDDTDTDGLVFEVDGGGNLVRVSRSWSEVVHVAREAMVGAKWLDFFQPEDASRFTYVLNAIREGAEFDSRHDGVVVRWSAKADGERVIVEGRLVDPSEFSPKVVSF